MKMFVFDEISAEVILKAQKETERIGYKFCDIVRYSNHPDDNYLYYVIGRGGYMDGYNIWLYNESQNSLCSGTYDLTFKEMLGVLAEKVNEI